jgi:hypothetical protein
MSFVGEDPYKPDRTAQDPFKQLLVSDQLQAYLQPFRPTLSCNYIAAERNTAFFISSAAQSLVNSQPLPIKFAYGEL